MTQINHPALTSASPPAGRGQEKPTVRLGQGGLSESQPIQETPMRAAALVLVFALPLQADTVDPVPTFDLQSAITCLAYAVNEIERYPDTAASRAEWMVFFSRLIAAKSGPKDHADFEARFAEQLDFLRNPYFEEGVAATPDEVDEILTGTGKMCWFRALAAEGGPYEGQ
jgi:hypothetical protein